MCALSSRYYQQLTRTNRRLSVSHKLHVRSFHRLSQIHTKTHSLKSNRGVVQRLSIIVFAIRRTIINIPEAQSIRYRLPVTSIVLSEIHCIDVWVWAKHHKKATEHMLATSRWMNLLVSCFNCTTSIGIGIWGI